MITSLSDANLYKVLGLFNDLWYSSSVPVDWRLAKIIPILKPGKKPEDVSSYRPIALTSVLCKLFERITLARLLKFYMRIKFFPLSKQFLSHYKGCDSLSSVLLNKILTARARRNLVYGISFDIQAAYDNVWHDGLLFKLLQSGIRARLFDPLGLIGPVITSAKIFLQRLWLQRLNWNDTVPLNDLNDWLKFLKDLPAVNKLEIPRCAIITNPVAIDLHCFCDASDKAYGAVLYLCSKNESGEVQTNILCSKSRVCPIKATTTPRLELSATLLLARLVSKVISIIQVQINHIYMWSDSTIALAWIKTPHEKLKTYVSNRVKTINTLCPNFDWRHVNSADNPADLISRGTSATNLVNNSLWFHGPTFIKSEISLPVDTIELNNNEFLNVVKTSCASVLICNSSNDFISDILNLSNSFTKLCRIVSYIFRFIHNLKNPTERKKGKLNISEIKEASNFMVKQVQLSAFSEEIKGLSKGLDIKQSKIKNLAPFLDEDNILRVGGRLQKTRLTQDEKHPKLLPAKHRLTKIIMESFTKGIYM
ncbi:hypothetical protein AVEN_92402-1 [Araneus ventricosus]|uniref:Reverse transcriptase domain-containing protein n=1 Tax=Araneus ventricosus TaxID=182803 RepID=A0A4Y2AH82_ARAVE|nr:hypothetical protein AVEN_92402-1 [Araneus ventricosus]